MLDQARCSFLGCRFSFGRNIGTPFRFVRSCFPKLASEIVIRRFPSVSARIVSLSPGNKRSLC
jgi:hypothetical protein